MIKVNKPSVHLPEKETLTILKVGMSFFLLMFFFIIANSNYREIDEIKFESLPITTQPTNDIDSNKLKTNGKIGACDGNWFYSEATGKIDLNDNSINDWAADTSPTLVSESIGTINSIILGHNWCPDLTCDVPGTQYSRIMNLRVGDRASLCEHSILFESEVFFSQPVGELEIQFVNDWAGYPVVTMLTSYGNCHDQACSSSDQRWIVAFRK